MVFFAGLSLEGATLRQDEDEDAKLYGKPLTNEILTGMVKRPATAGAFLAQLQRFSGKGVPPAVVPAKSHQQTTPRIAPDTDQAAEVSSSRAPSADKEPARTRST